MISTRRRQAPCPSIAATCSPRPPLGWRCPGTSPPARSPWPARPIRLVSPYGAGGSNDILTRVLGDFLSRRLGQSIVVENKAGAGTRIANESVAKAAPDGYTLLHAAAPIAIGEALYKELPYDVHKSFAAIGSTAIAPLFLVVNAQAPTRRWPNSSGTRRRTRRARPSDRPAPVRRRTSRPSCCCAPRMPRASSRSTAAMHRPTPSCWPGGSMPR